MRRALVTSLGLAGVAVAAVPVLAAPGSPVDTGRTAGIQVTTKLPDGDSLQLDIYASELSAGPRLVIDAERCDEDANCATRTYAGDLPGGDLSVSQSDAQARLATTLDGRDLTISWTPTAAPGAVVSSGTLEGDGTDNFFSEYSGASANAAVSYDGLGCKGAGGVGSGVIVDTASVSGTEVARPLSALHLPDGAVLHC
jgi:hypothetical protein